MCIKVKALSGPSTPGQRDQMPEVAPKDTEDTAEGFSGVQKDHKLLALAQRHCPLIRVQKISGVAEGIYGEWSVLPVCVCVHTYSACT